ncbi:MAG: antitoxin VapB family protein [Candidatus Bathyarchaeia archaeon]
MAHKTLTISEEAYSALYRLKSRGESFTGVILRLTAKTKRGSLLDYVRSIEPDEEFAETLEGIVSGRERTRIRGVRV